ncbi:MAG TPA: hypothetical protein PLE19_04400 [Planctomycetota bacterium]|nr:hypothetical protein [Planctomycetota bacterium]HRR79778.1 hypothetical protein [Planctomycetota bacterium]HRT94624.1 hypothetical protein [Planctomycetota bacterium]
MEETPPESSPHRNSLINFDLTRREEKEEPVRSGPQRTLVWAGLIGSLALMAAGTLITMVGRQPWGLFLFLAAAMLYLFCRCLTIGVLNTAPKLFSVILLLAGAFIVSRWEALSLMGVVGMVCLGGALGLMILGGFGHHAASHKRPGH